MTTGFKSLLLRLNMGGVFSSCVYIGEQSAFYLNIEWINNDYILRTLPSDDLTFFEVFIELAIG